MQNIKITNISLASYIYLLIGIKPTITKGNDKFYDMEFEDSGEIRNLIMQYQCGNSFGCISDYQTKYDELKKEINILKYGKREGEEN